MKKTVFCMIAVALVVALSFTACRTGVEKETEPGVTANNASTAAGDVSGTAEPSGDVTSEPITLTTSPYVNVTDASGNVLTTVVTDADGSTKTYYVQVEREAASQAAQSGSEVETMTQEATVGSVDEDQAKTIVTNFINTMNSKHFKIVGTMETEGESMPLDLVMYDSNVRMTTTLEGVTIAVCVVDGKTYLVSDENQQYVELTDSVKSMLGIDNNEFSVDFGVDISTDNISTNTEAVDGVIYNVYTCASRDNANDLTKFYVDNGKIVKLAQYENNALVSVLNITTMDGGITSEDASIPAGYKQVSVTSFVTSLMSALT